MASVHAIDFMSWLVAMPKIFRSLKVECEIFRALEKTWCNGQDANGQDTLAKKKKNRHVSDK